MEEILKAAETVIARHGYPSVTTNLIAKEGGFPVGSLYQFFSDRAAIYEALLEKLTTQIKAALDLACPGDGTELPLESAIERVATALVRLYLNTPLFQAIQGGGSSLVEQRAAGQRMMDQVTTRLAELIAEGSEVDARRANRMARVCAEISLGLLRLGAPPHRWSEKAVVGEITQVLAGYLKSEPGSYSPR